MLCFAQTRLFKQTNKPKQTWSHKPSCYPVNPVNPAHWSRGIDHWVVTCEHTGTCSDAVVQRTKCCAKDWPNLLNLLTHKPVFTTEAKTSSEIKSSSKVFEPDSVLDYKTTLSCIPVFVALSREQKWGETTPPTVLQPTGACWNVNAAWQHSQFHLWWDGDERKGAKMHNKNWGRGIHTPQKGRAHLQPKILLCLISCALGMPK